LEALRGVSRFPSAKSPRSQVDARLRDLTIGDSTPHGPCHFILRQRFGQGRGVVIEFVVACSRAVSRCSCRRVRNRVIAVRRVRVRRSSGVVGGPVVAIGRVSRVGSVGGRSSVGIGSGVGNERRPRSRLTRRRPRTTPRRRSLPPRARASAQRNSPKISRFVRVIGRDVTFSSWSRSRDRTVGFVVWRAAWRYVACWIARRVTGSVAGAGDDSQ
jgi:hypothetical protein